MRVSVLCKDMSTVNIKFLSNHDFILREFFQFAYAEKTFTDCVLYCQCDDRAGMLFFFLFFRGDFFFTFFESIYDLVVCCF